MSNISDVLKQLGITLPETPASENLASLAANNTVKILTDYQANYAAAQKKMRDSMTANMLKTFQDSMTDYNDMLTKLEASFAQMSAA